MIDKIVSLPAERIRPSIGRISDSQLAQIGVALQLWLALD
jgi:hypothetical protein